MDTKDPTDNPSLDDGEEIIEFGDDILEIDDDLIEEVEEVEPEKVAIKPPPMPPVPELPNLVAKNTGDIPFVHVVEPEKAYALPFANDLKDYTDEFKNINPESLSARYSSMAPLMGDNTEKSLYLFTSGQLAETTGDLGAALKNYGTVLDMNPALRPNLWALRSLIATKGLLEKTDMIFGVEQNQEDDPLRKAALLYMRGNENEAIGSFSKAEDFYREALSYRPDDILSRVALMRLREIDGDLSEASELCAEIAGFITTPEIKSGYLLYAGYLNRKNSNFQKACDLIKEALTLNPEHHGEMWFQLELCARDQGDPRAQFELLKEKAAWYLERESLPQAITATIEASVLAERELSMEEEAFEWLTSSLPNLAHPVLSARALQLALKTEKWDWILAQPTLTEWFPKALALLRSGKSIDDLEIEGDPSLEFLLAKTIGGSPEAFAQLARALPETPSSVPMLLFAALSAFESGTDADEILKRALTLDERGDSVLLAYAFALKRGSVADARVILAEHGDKTQLPFKRFIRDELRLHSLHEGDYDTLFTIKRLFKIPDQNTPFQQAVMAEAALATGRQEEAAELYANLIAETPDAEGQLAYTLLSARLYTNLGNAARADELIEAQRHNPELTRLVELLAREHNHTDRLLATLEEQLDASAQLELAFRRQLEDPTLFDPIDSKVARWQAAKSALSREAPQLYRDIMEAIALDYPEYRDTVLAKLAVELRDIFSEDAQAIAQRACEERCTELNYRIWWEQSGEETFHAFVHQEPPEMLPFEIIDRAFDLGWVLEDPKSTELLRSYLQGASDLDLFARLLSQLLAAKFDDWGAWIRSLPNDEVAEDCSRSTLQLVLSHHFEEKLLDDREPHRPPLVEAFFTPLGALTSTLAEIIPEEIITDEFASLVSVSKELKGKMHKAASARKVSHTDAELPALLAWSRHTESLGITDERIEVEARICDLLPVDHPRRQKTLETIAALATDDKFKEIRFRANWLLWTQFSTSTEAIARAWDIARGFSYDKVKGIVFHVLSEAIYGDALEEARGQIDPVILEDESLKRPLDEIDNLPVILSTENLSAGPMHEITLPKSPDTELNMEMCQRDAELLSELAVTMEKPSWLLECGRLFLLAENAPAARAALEDHDGDHVHKSLLLLAIALAERDTQEAYNHAMLLGKNDSQLIHALAMELGLALDIPPTEAQFNANRNYALSVACDLFARRMDSDGLREWLETQGEMLTLPYLMLLARLTEATDRAKAAAMYETITEGEMVDLSLLRQIRLAALDRESEKLVAAAQVLYSRHSAPWLALMLLRFGQSVDALPQSPLIAWFAAERGVLSKSEAVAQFEDSKLRTRLLFDHLMESGEELTDEIRELDPNTIEWDLLTRLRADYLEPDLRKALVASMCDSPLCRWWYELPADAADQELLLRTLERFRTEQFNIDPIPALDRTMPGQVANHMAALRRDKPVPELIPRATRDRFLAAISQSTEVTVALEQELNETEERTPLEVLLSIYKDTDPDPALTSIFTVWYLERRAQYTGDIYPQLLESLDEASKELLAWRAALAEELASGTVADYLLDAAPPEARSQMRLRRALSSVDAEAIAEMIGDLPEENETEALIKGTIGQLGGIELPELYTKFTSPLGEELFVRSSWRKQDWTELNTYLLNALTEEASESVKSAIYERMARIDGEGKGDEESEMYSREALAAFEHPDVYNLLRIIGYNRRLRQLQDELKSFRKLVLTSNLDEELPGISAELWRLDELSGLSLPDNERVLNTVAQSPDQGPILWWAYAHLRESFPREYLAKYFADLKDSHYIFSLAQVDQLVQADQYTEALELLTALAEYKPGFLPLIDKGTELAIHERTGAQFSYFTNLLAENFTPEEGPGYSYYLAGMALEQWDEDPSLAAIEYEKVLSANPLHKDAFLRLYAIYTRLEEYEKLAALLAGRIAVETAPEYKRRFLRDLGDIYMERLGLEQEGLDTYREYLKEVPYEKEVLTSVCQTLDKMGERTELISYLEQSLGYEKERSARAALFLWAAKSHDELGNSGDAINIYIKSLEMDQSQKEVWERLYELYLEKGEHKNSQRALKRALSLEVEVDAQVTYLVKMGLLYEEGFQDKRNAQASFVKAVEVSHGSLKAVEAMAAYYDRINDQVSKNIKIDMLWAKEVNNLAQAIKGETLNTIAHLLLYKGDTKAAQLLTEAAQALGVSQAVLPVKPSNQPISAEILTSSELTPFLYPEVVKNCHRNILHLIMPELPRVAKELFDVKPPDRKSLVESLPQGLDDLLDQFDATFEVHSVEGDEVHIIPFETPVILVGEKLLKIKEYTAWQAILGGKLVLFARGDIAAVELDHEALFNLYAGIVKVGFPQRDVAGFPEDERSDWVKLAGKILGRIDKNRYQGLILEMDSLSPDSIKGVKEGYGTAQLRSAYLLTGALAPFTALYENKPSMQPMLDELTRFIFTSTHFKLRENAVFVSMTS